MLSIRLLWILSFLGGSLFILIWLLSLALTCTLNPICLVISSILSFYLIWLLLLIFSFFIFQVAFIFINSWLFLLNIFSLILIILCYDLLFILFFFTISLSTLITITFILLLSFKFLRLLFLYFLLIQWIFPFILTNLLLFHVICETQHQQLSWELTVSEFKALANQTDKSIKETFQPNLTPLSEHAMRYEIA